MDVKDFNPRELQVRAVDDRIVVEGSYQKVHAIFILIQIEVHSRPCKPYSPQRLLEGKLQYFVEMKRR